jgi:hypothetical protein
MTSPPPVSRSVTVEPKPVFPVHQRHFVAPALQHRDPRLDEALALFGRRVLGVLAQVAELARPLDLFRKLRVELALQAGNLVVESLQNSFFHRFSR